MKKFSDYLSDDVVDESVNNDRNLQNMIKTRTSEVNKLLDQIKKKIEKGYNPKQELDWGHAGNLGYVIEILTNANNFLS
jgi:aromatic ring-opening dioxygenase LigB subunit